MLLYSLQAIVSGLWTGYRLDFVHGFVQNYAGFRVNNSM